jgi:transcriptional regulator
MYVPVHFKISNADAVHAFLRTNVFATIAGELEGRITFAYAPIVFDPKNNPFGSIRFHLARANPLAAIGDGASLAMSVMGPHAYVSPDWYATDGLVPTWNYTAVEGAGPVRRLSDAGLRKLLSDLSAQEEAVLAPKPRWTLSRVAPDRLDEMLSAIIGFELVFESLEGKTKLSQNRSAVDRAGVIDGLEKRGDAASVAVAKAMRTMRASEEE